MSSSVRVLVNGAGGRMGRELQQLIREDQQLSLAASVDAKGDGVHFKSISDVAGDAIDVVVDFSLPTGFVEVLNWCRQNKKPLVSGTTGLSDEDFSAIVEVAEEIPILWAPNMSLGVALLNELIQSFNKVADQYDFQVEEFHHRLKQDRPSGTAKLLQATLEKAVGKDVPEVMVARGGGIFGIHKVWAMGAEETICLEHTALNRRVFARGALRACTWLNQQPPGHYEIKHVLGY